jgi:hypothetical protein
VSLLLLGLPSAVKVAGQSDANVKPAVVQVVIAARVEHPPKMNGTLDDPLLAVGQADYRFSAERAA